jgi:regulation of enolase protein 1 (concanavalin A-like superfamily)
VEWYNEPHSWVEEGSTLSVTAEPKTDFWRKTHYGFIRDNGHFRFVEHSDDFSASVEVSANYHDQYDQAGLMLRVDEEKWVKCGIELVDGIHYASVVVTGDYSDWSCAPLTANPDPAKIRLVREGDVIMVHFSIEGGPERLIRVTRLDDMDRQVQIGMMAASPEGSGITAVFRDFHVVPK